MKKFVSICYPLKQKKLSDNTYNVQVYALRFFYCNVLKRPRYKLYLPTTKVHFKLPSILSVQEVERLLNACKNIKHRTLLMVVYGAGLRISEALNLKVSDIDRDRQTLHIRYTKNARERYVPLSPVIVQALTDYWHAYRFTDYVFPGGNPDRPLSQTSVAKVFKAAKAAAGIKKKGGIHSLRHSFAVHTLESGGDLIAIKRLLGHRSIHSTVRYCEFSPNYEKRFKSPIDALKL